jgi:hypothetical protein
MYKFFNKVMSFIIVLSQVSLLLPAEELRPDLRRGMVRLEQYLDRAAIERNAETWESLARAGLLAAMTEWENGKLYLREQDMPERERDRALAAALYEKETEDARARWLAVRVYEERAGFESGGIVSKLREAARAFTWNDGSGESRIVSFADGEKVRAAWEAVAGEIVGSYMTEWELDRSAAYRELEERFRGLDLEGEVKEKLLKEAGELRRAEVLREYRRIAKAEENSLMMELLYDHESLKSISGEKAAGVIARELAREAGEAADSATTALFLKLDTLIGEEDPGDIAVSSHDWLNQFRRAFEEGLAKWDAAELKFLAARAEWEREAEQIYLGGEEAWAAAYRELGERQLSWENELLQKLDEAYTRWQESGRVLEDEITEAREEFLAAAEANREIRVRMVKIQGEIYTRSRNMMSMAQAAIADWYERWGYMYENVYTRWQGFSNKGEIPGLVHNYLTDLLRTGDISYITAFQGQRVPEILKQYELWKQAYQKIIEYSDGETINQELLVSGEDLFDGTGGWVVIAGNYRSRADGAVQELYRAAGLDMENMSADGYLSELEREYLKALAVEEYWADERTVAAALNEYSIRNDSGLELSSRTLEELEKAQNAYDEAVNVYRDSLGFLDIRSAEIDAAQRSLENAQAELDRLRGVVEFTRQEINELSAILAGLQPDTVKIRISEKIAGMLKIYNGILVSGETEEETITIVDTMDSYFDAMQVWAEAQHMAEIFRILEELETLRLGETLTVEGKRWLELIRAYLLEDESTGVLSDSDIETMELIAVQYKTYRISEVNAADKEARKRVSALIQTREDQKPDPENLSSTMLFVRELWQAGEGLNVAGKAALKAYTSGLIEYTALRRVYGPGEVRFDITAAEAAYDSAVFDDENFTNYQYSVYDIALYLGMLGSNDFTVFTPGEQDLFIAYAGELISQVLGIQDLTEKAGGEEIAGEESFDEEDLNEIILGMDDWEWVEILLNLQADLREKIYRSVLSYRTGEIFFEEVMNRLEAYTLEKRMAVMDAAFSLEYANFVNRELDLGRFALMERLRAFQLDKALPENKLSKEQQENIGEALEQDAEDLYNRIKQRMNSIEVYLSNEKDWSYDAYNPMAEVSSLWADRDMAMEKLQDAVKDYVLAGDVEITACKELEKYLDLLETMLKSQDELEAEEKRLKEILDAAKTDLEKYNTGEYAAAIRQIQKSYENYNEAIGAAEESYRKMKNARLNLRERQEIYDWASSVYLNGFGRNEQSEFLLPKEKLSQADYAWERAKVSVEVLEEFLQRNHPRDTQYSNALEAYREAGEKYYTALVAAYEVEAAITRQKEIVRKAEAAVEGGYEIFVREDPSASLAAKDIVTLERNMDGSYRIVLGYGAGENKEEIYKAYFGERTEIVETVDGYREYTRAEIDARNWVEKIFAAPRGLDYFNDIMLAALYLNMQRGDAEMAAWFKEAGNPGDDGAYYILDGPNGTYHEVDVTGAYHDSRMDVLSEAYRRVCVDRGEEGREDLARYLLYRERCMVIGGAAAEKDLLEARALGKPSDALESKADEKYAIAWAAQGVAAGYFAAAYFVLTGAGALIQKGLAAQAVAIVNFALEKDYRQAYDRVESFKNANKTLSAEHDRHASDNFTILLNRKAELDRQQRKLYLMLFGEETKPANKAENRMSYRNFTASLTALFPSPAPGIPVSLGEKQAISQEIALALYHSALYQESGAFAGENVTVSLGMLNAWLEKGEAASRKKLAEEKSRLENIQQQAAADYEMFLRAAQEMPGEAEEKLRNYARLAADQSLSVAERDRAAAAYDALLAEINPASGDLRRTVELMAEKAWGAGTWNGRSDSLALMEFRSGLFNTLVLYSRDNEAYSRKALEDLENAAMEVINGVALSPLEVKEREWDLLREDWLKQYDRWIEQSAEILSLSKSAWEKAQERLNQGYYEWRNRFSGEYNAKNAEWELNYLGFATAKRDWVEEQYLRAEETGNGETLERLGMETGEAIEETLAELAVLRMSRDELDLTGYLETLLAGTNLSKLMAYTGSLENRSGSALGLLAPGPRRSQDTVSLAAAEKALGDMNEDIKKASVKLAAAQSLKRLEELKHRILSFIEAGNRDTWEWERKMVTEGGYSLDGIISREVVTDASLLSVQKKRQTVHRYQDYAAPDPNTHVDLSPLAIGALDPETVLFMIAQAEQDINEWGAELLSTKARDNREGKLEAHIGSETVFKDKPNLNSTALRNVQEMGKGEIGLITLDYRWNSLLALQGMAEIAKPVYDRKFWISPTGSIYLEPPTIRSVADMGMGIAAGIAMTATNAATQGLGTPAGMGVYFGVNMIDDLLFSAMDAIGGYKKLEDVGKELGIQGLTTAAGTVASVISSPGITNNISAAITQSLGESFWGSVANTTATSAISGIQSLVSGTTASAISATYWDEKGSLNWSWDLFQEGFKGTLANAASGFTGSMTSGLLGQLNLGKNGTLAGGFNSLQKIDMDRMNSFLGDMAASGVSYRLTGKASFNILHSDDFGKQQYSTGLLELHVGDNGITIRLGTGGTNISFGTLVPVFKGMAHWGISAGSEITARRDGVKNAATALRSQWGYGDSEGVALLLSVFDGSTRLVRGEDEAAAVAQTVLDGDKKKILLNRYQDEMSLGEKLLMGVGLQHEAYRDGAAAPDNYLETREAVLGHTETAIRMLFGGENLASGENLIKDIFAYVSAGGDADKFNAYVDGNYDSYGDYWLLKNDGTITDDGSADLHWEGVVKKDKSGKESYKTIWYAGQGMSKEESLVTLLGGKEQALNILQTNGISGADNSTEKSIGELILQNYMDENSVLSLDYSQFAVKEVTGKDWQAVYNSYAAHENFFNNNSWISGREDLLTRSNLGDQVTTKLEYYSLLFYPLTEELPLSGTVYENDPLAYLKANTEIVQFEGMGSVRVSSAMAPDLNKALEAAKLTGGTIPRTSGGLAIRFMNNDTLDELVLSDHATGMAVDFDAANNMQYFIGAARNNPEFNNYLKNRNISLSEPVTGYDANKKLALAFSSYESYLESMRDYYQKRPTQLTLQSLNYPRIDFDLSAFNFALNQFNYHQGLLKNVNSIPKLNFSMDKIFVENMRNYLDWGGDWKYQKDYMHFQARP